MPTISVGQHPAERARAIVDHLNATRAALGPAIRAIEAADAVAPLGSHEILSRAADALKALDTATARFVQAVADVIRAES